MLDGCDTTANDKISIKNETNLEIENKGFWPIWTGKRSCKNKKNSKVDENLGKIN